jgi:anti-sigma regulatory factor (Ser/Thr protein kinase)
VILRVVTEPDFSAESATRSETFAAQARELRRMSEWFRRFAEDTAVPEAAALDFELCLNELMENLVRHGCGDGCEHELFLTLEREPGSVSAVLEDDGAPFDPTSFTAPDGSHETIAGLSIGGWGIPIVRSFTSAMRYERRGDRNRTRIEMKLP